MTLLASEPLRHPRFCEEFSRHLSGAPTHVPQPAYSSNNSKSLPSIRHVCSILCRHKSSSDPDQAIPEIQAPVSQPQSTDTSAGPTAPGPVPSYVHSSVSNKRRRDPMADHEAKPFRQLPGLYYGPGDSHDHQPSPQPPAGTWAQPARWDPLMPSPNLSSSSVEWARANDLRKEERQEQHHSASAPYQQLAVVDTPRHPAPAYSRPQHPPEHLTELYRQKHDLTPVSTSAYARQCEKHSRYDDLEYKRKDKKRRKKSNFSKETTEILRGWLRERGACPTLDEKKELVWQTNLQLGKFDWKQLAGRHERLIIPPQSRSRSGFAKPVKATHPWLTTRDSPLM